MTPAQAAPDPHRATPTGAAGAPLGEASAALIMLHGRGASAADALMLGELLVPAHAATAILAPQAQGNTWYPHSFLAPRRDNEPFLSSALRRVESMIDALRAAGIARERTFIAGFSQGACLACEFIARRPDAVAAAAILTGGLIGERIDAGEYTERFPATPVYLSCGDADPHVPLSRVEASREILRSIGADARLEVFPGRPHTVVQREIEAVRHLFAERMGTAQNG